MKIAVFGCLHGMLNKMYQAVADYERQARINVDFIVVCGDCQTIRHYDDLKCLAVPNRFKQVGDFHEYYSGKKQVPKLTIFVGGNHEASNYLMTLPYGGWVCDNFYYLGYAGVVNYKGLRIGGISGIYNMRNCNRGRFEHMPFDDQSLRSIYHTRRLDVFRLQLLSQRARSDNRIDIFLSHDWPAHIYNHGDVQQLLRFKPLFKKDVDSPEGLGNPLTEPLVSQLQPKRWFAAHLHCRFYARVKHEETPETSSNNSEKCTEFLSLNKIEKGRKFVEFIDMSPADTQRLDSGDVKPHDKHSDEQSMDNVETGEINESRDDNLHADKASKVFQQKNDVDNLYYDAEWLTILRKTVGLENSSWQDSSCPDLDHAEEYFPSSECIQQTVNLMNQTGGMMIKRNFKMSEPVVYNRPDGTPPSKDKNRCTYFSNPQHEDLCSRLQIKSLLHQPASTGDEDKMKSEETNRNGFDKHVRSTQNHYHRNNSHQNRGHNRSHSGPSFRRGGRGHLGYAHSSAQYSQVDRGDMAARETTNFGQPVKRRAFELDEDGCLPCYVDKKGET